MLPVRLVLGFGLIGLLAVGCADDEGDPAAQATDAAAGGGGQGGAGGQGGEGGAGGEGGTPDEPPLDGPPTWHQHIAPILHANCAGCHHEGGIGPFALETHAQAAPLAALITAAVDSGRMPPWGAHDTDECTPRLPFKDDLRLSERDRALLAAWREAGAPEGDAATAAPLPERRLDTLADVDLVLAPETAFVTQGRRDQFRCFVLDPELQVTRYVNGAHFLPGNPLVVHHALLYVDQEGADADAAAGADGAYDCFGGPGIGNPQLVAAWAPGGVPMELPPNAGMPIAAGAKFVMQIHYHPLGDDAQEDLTSVQLRFTDGEPEFLAASALIGNFDRPAQNGIGLLPGPNDGAGGPRFRIPAGAAEHTESMVFTLPHRLDGEPFPGMFIHSVASHMHYVGTDMKIELRRPERTPPCTAAETDPLAACLRASCPDTEGQEAVACATNACGAEVAGLSPDCTDCLVAQTNAGADDVFAPCATVQDVTRYGTLPEQPAHECLLQTPQWDFSWQRFYTYDAPITELPLLQGGDVLEFRCAYDNSMANPFVRAALAEQGLDGPQDVTLGEETLDEMCLIALTLLFKTE